MAFEFLNTIRKELINPYEEIFEDLEEYPLIDEAKNDSLLNFYAKAGFLREDKQEEIVKLFMKAYEDNPIDSLKILFYVRDKEEGLGEKRIFRILIKKLGEVNSQLLKENLQSIPIFGRWDDLYSLFDTPLQGDAIRFIRKQIGIDLKAKNPSTLAKWLKSENASSKETKLLAKKTRLSLDLTSKEYRVLLSHLRKRVNIVETQLSKKEYAEVKYGTIGSSAMHKYHKTFLSKDRERYLDYLSVLRNEEIGKSGSAINIDKETPYNILEGVLKESKNYSSSYFIDRWEKIQSFNKGALDTLVCIGLSEDSIKKDIKPPAYICAMSTALYYINNNKGTYKNYLVTMTPKPNLVKVRKKPLLERLMEIEKTSKANELNVEAALDVILYAAIKNNLKKQNIPERLLFILDNKCKLTYRSKKESNNRDYFLDDDDVKRIKEKWEISGYEMPKLIFWRIDAYKDNSRIIVDSNGFEYAFGYSNDIFETIARGDIITSRSLFDDVLNNERYYLYNSDN